MHTAHAPIRIDRPAFLRTLLPSLTTVQLGESDRDRLRKHWQRLDPDDRRMRFMRAMSDRDLEVFIAALDFAAATRLGLLNREGEVVALAEGFAFGVGTRTDMEVAFSTDAAWRRCGLATRLFHNMAQFARERGADRLVLQCDRRNTGMRRVLKAVDAETFEESGEITAVWPCVRGHA
jgi:RimJ/RimL family protein N-acetyltransferase